MKQILHSYPQVYESRDGEYRYCMDDMTHGDHPWWRAWPARYIHRESPPTDRISESCPCPPDDDDGQRQQRSRPHICGRNLFIRQALAPSGLAVWGKDRYLAG